MARSGAAQTLAVQDAGALKLINPTAPDKAAHLIIKGIERDHTRVLVGTDAKLMDLFYRLSLRLAADTIYRLMKSGLSE